MVQRKPNRIYGKSGHPAIEALPLAVAFVVGVAGCIAFKFLPFHHLVGALFAGGVLVCYAFYTYLATELRLDAETIGDNCYYLGFLFTLTSLAVTLYFVIEAPSASRADLIPEIIAGFGVALSSTIFGVFLRVLMMQFKVDVERRERRERLELNEASRRFRTELGISLDLIKAFSVESLQHGAERESRMQEAFDKLLADMQLELLQSAQQFGPALRESVQKQTETSLTMVSTAVNESSALAANSIRTAMTEMTAIAAELSSQNTEAAERVGKSVAVLGTTAEAISSNSATTLARLLETQESTSRLAETFSREVSEGTDAMTRAMKNARQRLENGAQGFSDVAGRAGALLEEGTEKFARSFDNASKTVDDAGMRLAQSTDTVTEGFAARAEKVLDDGSERVSRSFALTIDKIDEAGERLVQQIDTAGAEVSNRADRMLDDGSERVGRSFATAIDKIGVAGERLVQQIDIASAGFSNRADKVLDDGAERVGHGFDTTIKKVEEAGKRLTQQIEEASIRVTTRTDTLLEQGVDKVHRSLDTTANSVSEAGERLVERIDAAHMDSPHIPSTSAVVSTSSETTGGDSSPALTGTNSALSSGQTPSFDP
ncbi:hypothetical protein Q4511_16095 [Paracoccus sp. 1_MG-2023]|uniref:hypothetical protein n=1 Tax=unclassified Paracoccus (in: a-proteobacteria) TaxID=2688777 RepID=UPI001C082454|nr:MULTISPECIES: hypothetical protein [unclassified Paracoccus (in: a-proteobacteria)]MBU2956804.1 hypothetical protein [Paracoccus sp. C2R09]MDO6670436.1 hypothetical protein [Paracoccus sp. 1_MG-2023]